ncbi:MAG: Rrf2 family transcriptional regulator [bacterium]
MLPQTAVYALRAMGYIASKSGDSKMRCEELSQKASIPRNYLSKILNRLVQAKLLNSTRGVRGGVQLARPAKAIRLSEVVALFMDMDEYSHCILNYDTCRHSCKLHPQWAPIMKRARRLLETETLDKLCN